MALTVGSLLPPVKVAGKALGSWALLLYPEEAGITDKVGDFGGGISFDLESFTWMAGFFQVLIARRPLESRLWPFSSQHLHDIFHRTVSRVGLDSLAPELYSLRHGGASHDIMSARRCLLEVKKRGRWRTDIQLRRYEKHAVLQKGLGKIPAKSPEYATRVEPLLATYFQQPKQIPKPPW